MGAFVMSCCPPILYLSESWANAWISEKSFAVHCPMSTDYVFRRLHLRLFPTTVPCMVVFARQVDRVTWPYHLSFLFYIVDCRSSHEPNVRSHGLANFLICDMVELSHVQVAYHCVANNIRTLIYRAYC